MSSSTRSLIANIATAVAVTWVANQVRKQVAPQLPPWATAAVVSVTTIVAQRAISGPVTRFVEDL